MLILCLCPANASGRSTEISVAEPLGSIAAVTGAGIFVSRLVQAAAISAGRRFDVFDPHTKPISRSALRKKGEYRRSRRRDPERPWTARDLGAQRACHRRRSPGALPAAAFGAFVTAILAPFGAEQGLPSDGTSPTGSFAEACGVEGPGRSLGTVAGAPVS